MTCEIENKIQELENRIKVLEELIFNANKPNPDPSYWQYQPGTVGCSADSQLNVRFLGQIDLRDYEK